MLFNSYLFFIFFFIVVLLYWRLGHRNQNRLLLVASYIFYGTWDWRFLSLIFISTMVDFVVGKRLASETDGRKRKRWLLFSVCTNLGILGFFKYFDFFCGELDLLLSALGFGSQLPSLNLILPVGISFYTFQTMSYTIDVYRGKTKPVRDLLDFAVYVCFFPQLVAGPIERSTRFMGQVRHPRKKDPAMFGEGLYLVVAGLFKKVVVADNMAVIVDAIFSARPDTLSGFEVLLGVYAFAFQIYGDFSGYSSIARGVSRWMGFNLMVNFRIPYLAISPRDFWARWHISLSTWLRDYLYIPLGGNRGSNVATYRNLMITMLLGGLWHGAAWTFVFWGFYHGLLLCVFRVLGDKQKKKPPAFFSHMGRMLLMFNLVCLGWLFFRADSMGQAFSLLRQIVSDFYWTPFGWGLLGLITFYAAPMLIYELWVEKKGLLALAKKNWALQTAFYGSCFFLILFFPSPAKQVFIYFQF